MYHLISVIYSKLSLSTLASNCSSFSIIWMKAAIITWVGITAGVEDKIPCRKSLNSWFPQLLFKHFWKKNALCFHKCFQIHYYFKNIQNNSEVATKIPILCIRIWKHQGPNRKSLHQPLISIESRSSNDCRMTAFVLFNIVLLQC